MRNVLQLLVSWDPDNLFGSNSAPSFEDQFAITKVLQWTTQNSGLMAAIVCGLPREAERQSITTPVSSIVTWVKRAELLLQPTVRIRTRISSDAVVDAPSLCGQIIWNLVHNAGKLVMQTHAESGGEIVILARQQGANLIVTVRDNGPGFKEKSEDQIKSLFKLYETGVSGVAGRGIGLYIVKTCVDALWAR